MNAFDTLLVMINNVLGGWIHAGSSMSSNGALAMGLF